LDEHAEYYNKKAQEPVPTEAEKQAFAEDAQRRCGRDIFAILRADELGEYQLYAARASAYTALHDALGGKGATHRVVAYFKAAEESRYIRDGAEDDEELARAMEALRGMRTAPLMADLPEETACTLWRRAGSWAGALTLAGLDPLDEKQRRRAADRYAAFDASPNKLPKKLRRRLSKRTYELLEETCELARRLRRCPTKDELPEGLLASIRADECKVGELLTKTGLVYTAKDVSPPIKKKKKPEEMTKLDHFFHRSNWWRNTEKFKEISRGKRPPPWTQNAQTPATHEDSADEK
jgi:hypothetical protein